ncbi:MAG: hypothetical protein EBZ77_01935, partial [Chitinophagia bacterium]|nr:hypothetical protein [Chitinophagia bacterium]
FEIQFRAAFQYPPYTRLFKVIFRHKDEQKAITAAQQLAAALQTIQGITIQGPGAAIVARIREEYIQEIWVKCPRDAAAITAVKNTLRQQKQAIGAIKGNSGLTIILDVDPY